MFIHQLSDTKSKTIALRLADVNDDAFIYSLRIDRSLNQYLSVVEGGIEAQRSWLIDYKKREASGIEYYFIIYRIDNNLPIGVVRMYDFKKNKESFSWGSWVLNKNKTNSSAVESMLLIYTLGFNKMLFRNCHFEVMKENKSVINFHLKYGAKTINEDEAYYYFNYSPNDFILTLQRYKNLMEPK